MNIVSGIAMIVETRIAANIVVRFPVVSVVSCDTALATPVRDLSIRNNVRNETATTRVLIDPRRIRNCSRFSVPVIFDPMIAAWLLPNPGKNEQSGETRVVAIAGLISSFFETRVPVIFCFGISVFVLSEWTRVDDPNSPVNSGKRGCPILRLKVAMPRNPASMKIIRALAVDSFSSRIKRIEIHIRNHAIILCMNG